MIKEGTPLLRRVARRDVQPAEQKEADSAEASSFAELTKKQTLIQQSFQSHHTASAAAQRKELGQSPPVQVALMNNFVADRAETMGAEMNEDLMTFQQKRRPAQQTQPRTKGGPLEAPSHLLKMQSMLPASRFDQEVQNDAIGAQSAYPGPLRHRSHTIQEVESSSHQKAYREQVDVEVELESHEQRRFYQGSINPADNESQASKRGLRAQAEAMQHDRVYKARQNDPHVQQQFQQPQPYNHFQTQQMGDPRMQARPQTSDIMRQHHQKYGAGQPAHYTTQYAQQQYQ